MTGEFAFHGLARLASEHGLDVRATVLRVATDLFCQNPAPSSADRLRYTDLACALLAKVDPKTRRQVAEKLARTAHTPERLLRLLLDDEDVTVAATVIQHSALLQLASFSEFLIDCGPAEAAAIARRADIDGQTIRVLASHTSELVVETLLENASITFDTDVTKILATRACERPNLSALLFVHPACDAAELAVLYSCAPDQLRRNIRDAIERRPARALPAVPIQAALELNEAILNSDVGLVGATLGKALRLDPTGISRILHDCTGEVLVLGLSAAGIKRAPAIRFLLTCGIDEVRMSVERIFAAADIFDRTPRRVAREIVTAVAGERRDKGGTFEPHMLPSETPQRSFGMRRRMQSSKRPSRRADIVGRS